jgi:hypothetical protein
LPTDGGNPNDRRRSDHDHDCGPIGHLKFTRGLS